MTLSALFCSDNADGLLIWRLCGSSKPRMPLVIPYPEVWIHFVTDERVEHVGFHAQYSFTGKTDDKLSNSSAKTIHKFLNDIFQKSCKSMPVCQHSKASGRRRKKSLVLTCKSQAHNYRFAASALCLNSQYC